MRGRRAERVSICAVFAPLGASVGCDWGDRSRPERRVVDRLRLFLRNDQCDLIPRDSRGKLRLAAPMRQGACNNSQGMPLVNPTDELNAMISRFPESGALFAGAEHIPAALTPEPYKRLLVHDGHMTVAMEDFHGSPVGVKVLDRKLEGNIYSRKILLSRNDTGAVVQFAVMTFDLEMVLPAVREQILAERTPLGRILIDYNVFRFVDLGAIFRITSGPIFAQWCDCATGEVTYARLATIFCNQHPAVDLLEVAAPIK